ncbi:MAG: PQQ-dependent sugar dehydrogenase [Chloroflexi bacterium]|nr:PQQ-dependent sugar dehydrogenase [Chloroflexota bacterium]
MLGNWLALRRFGIVVGLLLVVPLVWWSGSALAVQPAAITPEPLPPTTSVQTFVADAGGFVVAMAFAPDGRMFYTVKPVFAGDQDAQVRIVENGVLRPTPFVTTRVNADGERGLLGIALDPSFAANSFVYIYKTAPASETGTGRPANRVVRLTEDPATQTAVAGSAVTLLDVPIGAENDPNTNHNGGNLHFGPDGKLYVTIGDYGRNSANSQNLAVPMGKIHRFNADGTIPVDNPFFSAPPGAVKSIWTLGNRNSFDFAFDPIVGRMFFTENGPSCDDEVNLGAAGANYGWPNACGVVPPGTVAPLFVYAQPIGIAGIDFYTGPIAEWRNSLFWCAVNNGLLYRGTLDETRTQIQAVNTIAGAPLCNVDVQHGPEGALYLSFGNVISRIAPHVIRFPFAPRDGSVP